MKLAYCSLHTLRSLQPDNQPAKHNGVACGWFFGTVHTLDPTIKGTEAVMPANKCLCSCSAFQVGWQTLAGGRMCSGFHEFGFHEIVVTRSNNNRHVHFGGGDHTLLVVTNL
jgi:hypothetical protein